LYRQFIYGLPVFICDYPISLDAYGTDFGIHYILFLGKHVHNSSLIRILPFGPVKKKIALKNVGSVRYLVMFLKEVSYAHHGCIYLIKNTVKL